MTTLTIGEQKGGFDMSTFDIGQFAVTGSDTVASDHRHCTITHVGGSFADVYAGESFHQFDKLGVPRAGTIHDWNSTFLGSTVFEFSRFAMDWQDYLDFANSGDTAAFLGALLSGNDRLIGGPQDDTLFALDGDDSLFGGKGKDKLDGDNGADKLSGGGGADKLTGGHGDDIFVFTKLGDSPANKEDTITDWGPMSDRIDLHKIDADTTADGNQAFHLGGDTFTNTPGEIIIFAGKDGHVHLEADVNGDGFADFDIRFLGKVAFSEGNFIF
jgi:serralysin